MDPNGALPALLHATLREKLAFELGFPTSVVCTERTTVLSMSALLLEKAPWWSMIDSESTPLLDAANAVLP